MTVRIITDKVTITIVYWTHRIGEEASKGATAKLLKLCGVTVVNLSDANNFIERQLDKYICGLEKKLKKDVISYRGDLINGVDDAIRDVIESKAHGSDELAILLTTSGGYIETVARVVEAEVALLLNFDQAELYKFDQARELTITLLKDWLVKYKFRDWKMTETSGTPVDDRLRTTRAAEIAKKLNDTDRWHSHGYGISMEVLRHDLGLKIDDFGANQELSSAIRSYHH